MSATQTAAPLTPADARGLYYREIFQPTFFDKLAANGHGPANEEEAVYLINMGVKLLNAERLNVTKQAGSRLEFLKAAEHQLDGALRANGIQVAADPADPIEVYLKQASEDLVQHPLVVQAASLIQADNLQQLEQNR